MAEARRQPEETHARDAPGAREHRDAARPHRFTFSDYKAIGWRVFMAIGEENLLLIAAGVTFYSMLALFPALIALVSVYGYLANPVDMYSLVELLKPLVPTSAYDLLYSQVEALSEKSDTTFTFASVGSTLLAIWSAKAGVNALLSGLNIANRERDDRSILKAMALSYALTLGLIIVMVITVSAIVVIPAALSFVQNEAWQARLVDWLRWPIAVGAVVLSIGFLYRAGPSRRAARVPWLSPGALLATAVWMIASVALSYYISTFGNYQATYGALGAVVALMLWLWLGTLIVLVGARVNAEMEYQTSIDTTVGPPRPMGQRGAFVADHVAWEEEEDRAGQDAAESPKDR